MQIDWKPLSRAEMAKGLSLLQELLGDTLPANGDLRLRRAPLSFYPDLSFFEVTDQSHEPPRQLYALVDEDKRDVTVLDMTNQPVYGLNNQGYLRLNEHTVIPYAAFFFSCVAGPYGLMPVIERLELPPGAAGGEGADAETAEALESVRDVVPPRILGREDAPEEAESPEQGWRLAAALLFQGAVFKTELVLDANGVIRVDKHELALASDAPEGEGEDDADAQADEATH